MDKYLVDVRFTVEAGSEDAALSQVLSWLTKLGKGRAVTLPPGVDKRFEIATVAQKV